MNEYVVQHISQKKRTFVQTTNARSYKEAALLLI